MQSESRVALPYLSRRTVGDTAGLDRRPRVASLLRTMLPELLIAWDAGSFFCSGMGVATRFVHQNYAFMLVAAVGALLAPVVIRARRPGPLTLQGVRSLGVRAAGIVVFASALAGMVRDLGPMPLPWAAGWLVAAVALLVAGRVLAVEALRAAAAWFGGERVAVIGSGREADGLRATLRRTQPVGVEMVAQGRRGGLHGVVADLLEQGRRGMLDRVILAQPGLSTAQVGQIAHRLKALQIEVASLAPPAGGETVRPGGEIAGVALFIVSRRPQWGYGGIAKLLVDRCMAVALLVWLSPLLALIGAAIWIDSPGPVLFRQRREGVNGGEFEIFKFRTMVWQGRQAGDGAVQTERGDRRITRIGAMLRRSSLDEVPQLLNVLNGTMSLVGPRPHPTAMRTEERLGGEITPEYAHRQRVKPGITGWAQINGLRGATETADALRRRIEHDNYYIENWSPWFDLRILAMTPVSLLVRRTNAF